MDAATAYWAGVAAIAMGQAIWWAVFAACALRGPHPWSTFVANFRTSTKGRLEVLRPAATPAETDEIHRLTLDRYFGMRVDALTLGALALAAWAALAAQRPSGVEDFSLRILFLGVVFTLSGPVLFRSGGSEGTHMGLSTALALGYSGIVISLASLLPVVFDSSALDALGLALTLAIVLRQLAEVRADVGRTRELFGKKKTPAVVD